MDWSGKDNRKFVRVAVHCKIFIRIPGKEHTIACHTENIGEGGLQVKIEEKVDTFSLVFLDLSFNNQKILIEWKVNYASKREEKSPYYETGIEFQKVSDKNMRLINNFVNQNLSEK